MGRECENVKSGPLKGISTHTGCYLPTVKMLPIPSLAQMANAPAPPRGPASAPPRGPASAAPAPVGVPGGQKKQRMSFKNIKSRFTDGLLRLITRSTKLRTSAEVEVTLPVLKWKCALFNHMSDDLLRDVLWNVTIEIRNRDDLILKQGEVGDKFYVILSGSVSVYIDHTLNFERRHSGYCPPKTNRNIFNICKMKSSSAEDNDATPNTFDRTRFGRHVQSLGAGTYFGELGMLDGDYIRNATVIADNEIILMVFGFELYKRTAMIHCEARVAREEKAAFINKHQLFSDWTERCKRFLHVSLQHHKFPYGWEITRQGEAMENVFFLVTGEAEIHVAPRQLYNQLQYILHVKDSELVSGNEGSDIRNPALTSTHRRRKKSNVLPSLSDSAADLDRIDPRVRLLRAENVAVKRILGYVAAERKELHKNASLCAVVRGEFIGDVEMILDLPTYVWTVTCRTECSAYSIDMKYLKRYMYKRNPLTVHLIKEMAESKLVNRMTGNYPSTVPVLQILVDRIQKLNIPEVTRALEEVRTLKVEATNTVRRLPPLVKQISTDQKDSGIPHLPAIREPRKQKPYQNPESKLVMSILLKFFHSGRAPMLRPATPGALFFKDLMQQRSKNRALDREKAVTAGRIASFPSLNKRLKDSWIESLKQSKRYVNMRRRLDNIMYTRDQNNWKY